MLVVPLGRFRALVTIEPENPDRVVVGSVFRDDGAARGDFRPDVAVRGKDMARA